MSASFFTEEMGRNLRRSPLSHIGSLVMAGALFALLDILWIGAKVADSHFVDTLSQAQMEVFFSDELSEEELDSRLAGMRGIEGVERVELISKEMARERLRKELGMDYLADEDENPLPRSAVLNFSYGFPSVESLKALAERFSSAPGVLQVSYNKEWLARVEENRLSAARLAKALLGGALVAALFNAALLAGLIVKAKTRRFAQLRMLGAGTGFMGLPVIVEGGALAALAAALSWVVLYTIQDRIPIAKVAEVMPDETEIALMIAVAALVGALGAYMAVKVAIWRSK